MPIVISPNLVGNPQELFKSCIAVIGYQNHLFRDDVTITSNGDATGFPARAVTTPMTYERWLGTDSKPEIEFDLQSQYDVDYVGIGAHTLNDGNITAAIYSSANGTDWTQRGIVTSSTPSAVMLLMAEVTARYWRITLSDPAEIGVVYIGKVMYMPVQMYGGHTPITLSRQTEIMPNKSVKGQFLGRSIVRQGYATSYSWKNIPAAWYRARFEQFVKHATKYPFFIAWNPIKFTDEVAYAWTKDDIAPVNMGVRDLMSVSFSVEAVG